MNVSRLIFLFLLIIATAGFITTASPAIQIISPANGQVFHYGQQLILIAKYAPNAVATVYLVIPNGKAIPEGAFEFNSTGYLALNLGTFGSGNLVMPGSYSIEIEVSGEQAAVVSFIYQPYVGTIVVEVQNSQHLPIPGATVYLYNITSGIELVGTEATNDSGIAVFHVVSFNTAQNFKVVASFPGYANSSSTVTITQNQTKTVLLTLYPAVLNIYVVDAEQEGLQIDPFNPAGYTSLVAIGGENITVYIETMFANIIVPNATVVAELITPTGKSTSTATPLGNGTYKVSFNLPLLNVPYDALLNITAEYNSMQATATVPISVQFNYTVLQQHLQSQISSLEENITKLENVTTQLNSELTKLENVTTKLEKTVSSLQEVTSLLSSEISNLNTQVSTLNKKLVQLTPFIYGALAAGIIGVILATLALVAIRRALS